MRKNYTNPSMSLLKYEAAEKVVMLSIIGVQNNEPATVDVKINMSDIKDRAAN